MQNKKTNCKKILTMAGAASMVLANAIPVMAAPDMPATTNVDVIKLQFLDGVDEIPTIDNQDKNINDNTELSGKKYDVAKYGVVEFSAYQLDKAQVDDAVAQAGELTPQQVGARIAKEVEDAFLAGTTLPYGATLVETKAIDSATSVANFALNSDSEQAYVILESKSPATVIGKAVPMFVELPFMNKTSDGYKDAIFLEAKNNVRPVTITLNKQSVDLTRTEAAMPGVSFELYKEEADGTRSVVPNTNLTTDDEGNIVLSDVLAVGKYFFVEKETTDLVDGMVVEAETAGVQREGVGEYLASRYALNDEENKVWFELHADGTVTFAPEVDGIATVDASFDETTGSGVITLDNNMRPNITKDIEGIADGEDKSFDKDEIITYNIGVDIPGNILEYTMFEFEDIAQENLVIDVDTVAIEGLVKDTDFTVTPVAGGYKVNFIVTNGKVTDAVAALTKANVSYEAKITDPTPIKLVNDVVLTYKNGAVVERYDADKEEVETLGRKFFKVDAGRFGLVNEANLAGAEFILSRDNAGTTEYLQKSAEGVFSWTTVEADAFKYVSDANLGFEVTGLGSGTYTLTEVKAPAGFNLPDGDNAKTEFVLDATSYEAEATDIKNTRTSELPMTGSEKLMISFAIGATGLISAVVIIKRKEDEEGQELA